MRRLLAIVRLVACVAIASSGIAVIAGIAGIAATPAGANEATVKIFNTYFGYWTNTPPSCTGGTCTTNPGTYTRPIGSASDESEPGFAKGTVFYYPMNKKYYKVTGSCQECSTTYKDSGFARMDLYLGGGKAPNLGTAFSLIDCEDALTLTFTGVPEQTTWIRTPPANLPVTPLPLYTTTSGRCHNGGQPFPRSIGTSAKSGKCIENPTDTVPPLVPRQSSPHAHRTTRARNLEFDGAWFYNHGLCLDFTSKNHDTLKWTKCTENKTAEL